MTVAAMAKKNLAELLVDTLVAAGVKRIYGLAGDSLNGSTDAIRTDERIKWIHVDVVVLLAGDTQAQRGHNGATKRGAECVRGAMAVTVRITALPSEIMLDKIL